MCVFLVSCLVFVLQIQSPQRKRRNCLYRQAFFFSFMINNSALFTGFPGFVTSEGNNGSAAIDWLMQPVGFEGKTLWYSSICTSQPPSLGCSCFYCVFLWHLGSHVSSLLHLPSIFSPPSFLLCVSHRFCMRLSATQSLRLSPCCPLYYCYYLLCSYYYIVYRMNFSHELKCFYCDVKGYIYISVTMWQSSLS